MRNTKRIRLIAATIVATLLSVFFCALPSTADQGQYAPNPPTNVTASVDGSSIVIAWDPSVSNDFSVVGYEVDWRHATNDDWQVNRDSNSQDWSYQSASASASTITLLGFAPGLYDFRVVAFASGCQVGDDCFSAHSYIAMPVEVGIAPDPNPSPDPTDSPSPDPTPDPTETLYPSPTNVTAVLDGDNLTLTWQTPVPNSSVTLDGYDYRVIPQFFHSDNAYFVDTTSLESAGYYLGNVIEQVGAADQSVTIEHLMPVPVSAIEVRARYTDSATSSWVSPVRENDTQVLRVDYPHALIDGNYQRLYQDEHNVYLPHVTGVAATYSVVYHSGYDILRVGGVEDLGDSAISWGEISQCRNYPDTISVDVMYLTASEKSSLQNSSCIKGSTEDIPGFTNRSVGSSSFHFLIVPIPRATASFEITQPTDLNPVIHDVTAFDGEDLNWYPIPLENGRDRRSLATFVSWEDVTSPEEPSTDLGDAPVPGHSYRAIWRAYENPLDIFSLQLAGQQFDLPGTSTHMVWDAEDESILPLTVRTARGITWLATLAPADSRGYLTSESYIWTSSATPQPLDISTLSGCETDISSQDCPKYLVLNIRTFDGTSGKDFTFYILRDSSLDEISFAYSMPQDPDPQSPIQTFTQTFLGSPRWVSLYSPEEFYDFDGREPFAIFAGWCTTENPTTFDDCYHTGDYIAVIEDMTLYALWVPSAAPKSIQIGGRTIDSSNAIDWIVDEGNKSLYVTVSSSRASALVGEVSILGSTGINFEDHFWAFDQFGHWIGSDEHGEYTFDVGCPDAGGCATLYSLNIDFWGDTAESQFSDFYGGTYDIYLIVKPETSDQFAVSYDLGGGSSLTPQVLSVGWHPLPHGPFSRQGFITEYGWQETATGAGGWWENVYPVLSDEVLSLIWASGPIVSAPSTKTMTRGQTTVATATSIWDPWSYWNAPSEWNIFGTTDFTITNSGEISAREGLPSGTYTFSISTTTYDISLSRSFEGPRFTITVTVEDQPGNTPDPGQIPSGDSGSGANSGGGGGGGGGGSSAPPVVPAPEPNPTDKPVEVKPAPKPELLQQPAASASVGRSQLGVGATTKVAVRGGLANGAVKYSSTNSKVCSVDSRGSVTAKSVGVCWINTQVLSSSPEYAPATAAPIRISVLGQGLVDSATIKVKDGSVSVVASLLKKYAGKRASLFEVKQSAGKSALVSRGWVTLDRNAVASFSPFKQGKGAVKVVVMVAGKKVYDLSSK